MRANHRGMTGKHHSAESKEKLRIANTGRKHTPEEREKMRLAHLGKPLPESTKENMRKAQAGKNPTWLHTPEVRERIVQKLRGRKMSPEACRKMSESRRGHPTSPETRLKISMAQRGRPRPWITGENNWKWRGGVSPLKDALRKNLHYRQWRRDVFSRDNNTCQVCGAQDTEIHAHHCNRSFGDIVMEYGIKSIADAETCADLWDIGNGQTLCEACHIKAHRIEVEQCLV